MKEVYRFDENGFYFEPVEIEDDTELPVDCCEEVPPPFFKAKWENGVWVEGATQEEIDFITGDTLENAKLLKIEELNQSCNDSILAGFFHTINNVEYHFNFDVEAQLNFQGAERLLDKGLISEIEWTVTNNGTYERIIITKEIMDQLVLKILQHKDANIRRFRNELMPLVEAAQTKEELKFIYWDMEVSTYV